MCGYYTLPGECGKAPQKVVIVVVRDDGACGSIPTVWQDAPRTLPASEASREAVEEPREAGAYLSRQVDRARLPADLEERLKASVKEDANSVSEQPEFLSDNDI
jgi:hypothetical protein